MAVVERTALIDATPAQVWAVLADFAAISRWASNVDHSCLLTEQSSGVGAVRRIQSGGVTVVETVESWEPDVSVSYRITGLPPVIKRVTNSWQLLAADTQTRVMLTTQIDAGSRPPQRLIAKAVGRKLAEASDQMLAGLAEAVRDAAAVTPVAESATAHQEQHAQETPANG